MVKRLTHEFVEQEFSKAGYTLLSKYSRCDTRMDFICDKGHNHAITWDNFKAGKRCASCAGNVRLSHEFIKCEFEKVGYTLLSDSYLNNYSLLDFVCNKGHKHKITWREFNSGSRCAHCIGRIVTHEQVESEFARDGYTLLSGSYLNNRSLLDFMCPAGHRHRISWDAFKKGNRCGICSGLIVSHSKVQQAFDAANYTLHSTYKDCHTLLRFTCDKGHKHKISWSRFAQGRRCGICANNKKIENEVISKAFQDAGYTLLSEYVNHKWPLSFICDRGHHHRILWNKFSKGHRCTLCYGRTGGFDPSKPGILYYLKFVKNGMSFYKIGITNLSIEKRYARDPIPYKVLMEKTFIFGDMAKKEEKRILRKHKKYRYKGAPILINGNTELFTRDVLNLDTDSLRVG
jgi:hypothetical protein